MDNDCRSKNFSSNLIYSRYRRAIITLVIGFRQKSTHHRGNLWRRKTYRPLIALIDNHSKDAARFWGSALFSFQFPPLGTNSPRQWPDGVRGGSFLSLSFCRLGPAYPARFVFMPLWFFHFLLLLLLLLRHRASWLWEIAMIEHVNVWFGLYRCL